MEIIHSLSSFATVQGFCLLGNWQLFIAIIVAFFKNIFDFIFVYLSIYTFLTDFYSKSSRGFEQNQASSRPTESNRVPGSKFTRA